jgi:hypothetical protein
LHLGLEAALVIVVPLRDVALDLAEDL